MPTVLPCPPAVFAPRGWVLPPAGTNGYISTWGEMLAGVCPTTDGA